MAITKNEGITGVTGVHPCGNGAPVRMGCGQQAPSRRLQLEPQGRQRHTACINRRTAKPAPAHSAARLPHGSNPPAGQTGWYAHFYGGAPKYHEIWLSQVRGGYFAARGDMALPSPGPSQCTADRPAVRCAAMPGITCMSAARSADTSKHKHAARSMQLPVGTSMVWSSRYPAGTKVRGQPVGQGSWAARACGQGPLLGAQQTPCSRPALSEHGEGSQLGKLSAGLVPNARPSTPQRLLTCGPLALDALPPLRSLRSTAPSAGTAA